jgi:hypothetical protein
MKKVYFLYVVLVAGILFSCKKDKQGNGPVTPPPSDIQQVLLKDVIVQGLPSPFYHFVYDDSGYITQSSFSSGIRMYEINYAGRRISEIKSIHPINKDRMVYQYQDGKVILVKYINEAGVNFKRCFISYNLSGQITEMEWEIKNGQAGFVLQQAFSFLYYPDGNLKERQDQRYRIDGQQDEALYIDRFENYDAKMNVDGFTQLHNEDDHLLLLPGKNVQKNNPGKEIRSGTGIHYEINYNYTYNETGRPVGRNGSGSFTNGPNAGQTFQLNTSFTYYP